MDQEKISEYEKALPDLDLAEWKQYQMSLSSDEIRMQAEAMLNVRRTHRFLAKEIAQGDASNWSQKETGVYIRMMVHQLSQIEHWSFEAWREARRSRLASTTSLAINVACFVLLLTAVFLTI